MACEIAVLTLDCNYVAFAFPILAMTVQHRSLLVQE